MSRADSENRARGSASSRSPRCLRRRSAGRASKHDREASFPFESLAAIKRSGYLAAPIPAELGGLGVTSLHDVLVASSRLARGDAALTLGVNMHLVFVLNVVRLWQVCDGIGRRATRRRVRRDDGAGRARVERSSRPRSASRDKT